MHLLQKYDNILSSMINKEKSTSFIGIKSLRVPYVDIFLFRYAPIGIAKILLYEVIKGFKYCSLFPIFEETLPYKFKPIFI